MEHYLQLAMYLIAMDKDVGYLWNVRTNELCEVRIKEGMVREFIHQVYKIVTKSK